MKTKSFTELVCVSVFALTTSFVIATMAGCKDEKKADAKAGMSNDSASTRSGGRTAKPVDDTIRIAAATYPVAWLGCEIVGMPCRATALVPPGASAHSWEPRPSDLRKLNQASVFVQAGLAFENAWIPRFRSSVPDLEVVDARAGLDLSADEKGHKGHSSEESDPHVWSSPRAMDRMADVLASRLIAVRPDLRGKVTEHLPEVHRKLLELDTAVRVLLAPYTGKTFLVNHPGLGYLARDYGLTQKPLESHGQDLTPVMLWDIRRTAKAQGIKTVFIQNEYSRRTADQVAKELGVGTVDVDLLGEGAYDSLFLANIRIMADKL